MEEKHLIADIPQKAIINKNSKVLLVRNSESHWQLPGGRLNEGENPREGIIREIREELGVDAELVAIYDVFVFQSKSGQWHYVVVWECKLLDETAPMKDLAGEATQMVWVSTKEEADRLEHDGSVMWREYKHVLEKYFGEKYNGSTH